MSLDVDIASPQPQVAYKTGVFHINNNLYIQTFLEAGFRNHTYIQTILDFSIPIW